MGNDGGRKRVESRCDCSHCLQSGTSGTQKFWERQHSEIAGRDSPAPNVAASLEAAIRFFGDVRGRRLLDIGCGAGEASLHFARMGADVVALDYSSVAIDRLVHLCEERHIPNIEAVHMSAQDVEQLGSVDLVYGAFILHHLEPFSSFASSLRRVVSPKGKAFFWENSDRNRILMWCRDHLVGRLGIPRHGDGEERPLSDSEIAELRSRFHVQVDIPELFLTRLLSAYLLGNRFWVPFARMDGLLHKIKPLRKYSYIQYLYLS